MRKIHARLVALILASSLAGCGHAERSASAGHEPGLGGAGLGGAGLGGAGGASGSGNAPTETGGATALPPDSSSSPCRATERAPVELCVGAACPLTRALELTCTWSSSAFSLALDAEKSLLAFSAQRDSAGTTELSLIDWQADGAVLNGVAGIGAGQVLAGPSGIARLAWIDKQPYWLNERNEPGEAIQLPTAAAVQDVLLDAQGVAHFLITQVIDNAPTLDIVASNGETRHVLDGVVASAKLVAAESVGVVYVELAGQNTGGEGPPRVLRWNESSEPTVLAEFDQQALPAKLSVVPWGSAASLDFHAQELTSFPGSGNPGQAAQDLLFMTGSGSAQRAWAAAVQPFPCAGQYTAYAPDICSSKTRSAARGDSAPLGVHALASTSDGSVWLARLSGSLDSTCRWVSMNACFETLPCDCREVLSNTYALSLSLYRAPDFGVPALVVRAPAGAQEATLVMASHGERLSIVTSTAQRYDSKVWWLDVNTALVPKN